MNWPNCDCGQPSEYFRHQTRHSNHVRDMDMTCRFCAVIKSLSGEAFGIKWDEWEPTVNWYLRLTGVPVPKDTRKTWERSR